MPSLLVEAKSEKGTSSCVAENNKAEKDLRDVCLLNYRGKRFCPFAVREGI